MLAWERLQFYWREFCVTWFFPQNNLLPEETETNQLFTFQFLNKKIFKLIQKEAIWLELVSKELNHLAAILHVYAGGLNFMK